MLFVVRSCTEAAVGADAGEGGGLVRDGLLGDAERRRDPVLNVDLPRAFVGLGQVDVGPPVCYLDGVDGPQVPVLGDLLADVDPAYAGI